MNIRSLFVTGFISVIIFLSFLWRLYAEQDQAPQQHISEATYPMEASSHKDTVELGQVQWLRNYEVAKQTAIQRNQLLLILFQEVPGCQNCQRFGQQVLSHPLFVDAMEEAFVPICIFNNHPGADRAILQKFREPTWNNPVVRVIDPLTETDVTPRMARFHPQEIAQGMVQALNARGQAVPRYLQLLQQHLDAQYGRVEEATFPMYCFWSGELKLGQLPGVVATTPGFMHGREVVKVQYDADQTSYRELVEGAQKRKAIEGAFVHGEQQASIAQELLGIQSTRATGTFRRDAEPSYYLFNSPYKHVPMLPTQRIHVNRAIFQRQDPQVYLSPSQIEAYQQLAGREAADYTRSTDLVQDWAQVQAYLTQP